MGSCQSLSNHMKDFWEEWDDLIKPVVAGGVSALTGVPPQQVIAIEEKIEAGARDAIKFWNNLAGNGTLRVGPRSIRLNDSEKGTLRAAGQRTFISSPIVRDEIEFRIKKTGGRARTEVTVCRHKPNGKHKKLWEFEFDKGRSNEGQVKKKKLSGVRGSIITVLLSSKNVVNTFSYQVRLKKGAASTSARVVEIERRVG